MPGRQADDQIAIGRGQRTPRHDQAAVRRGGEGRDGLEAARKQKSRFCADCASDSHAY